MTTKLALILPEILLVVGAIVVTVLGLARTKMWRDAVPAVTIGLLLAAAGLVHTVTTEDRLAVAGLVLPGLGLYAKTLILLGGAALVLLGIGLIDRKLEAAFASGRAAFDAIRVMRGQQGMWLVFVRHYVQCHTDRLIVHDDRNGFVQRGLQLLLVAEHHL